MDCKTRPAPGTPFNTWPALATPYGQAYRPQSNGKAESAVKSLDDIIRKTSLDSNLPGLEVLPRAIVAHNDLPGESCLSPHKLLLGHKRLGQGPKLPTEHEAEDIVAFMD